MAGLGYAGPGLLQQIRYLVHGAEVRLAGNRSGQMAGVETIGLRREELGVIFSISVSRNSPCEDVTPNITLVKKLVKIFFLAQVSGNSCSWPCVQR